MSIEGILSDHFHVSKWLKVLNTFVYHNMHHSDEKGNYSLYFWHWDIWMKTENVNYEAYRKEKRNQRFEYFNY